MAETETEIEVTPEVLRELLDYDPETGVLTWKERDVKWFRDGVRSSAQGNANKWNARFAGTRAFSENRETGYVRGPIFRRTYRAHRVAYAIMTGEWPKEEIDHIDGIRSNNKWSNLRAATRSENCRNKRTHSRSGYKGVYPLANSPGLFQCLFRDKGKLRYLGSGRDPEELARLWDKHAKEMHGDFAKLNFPDE